jgi:hypothetical protein
VCVCVCVFFWRSLLSNPGLCNIKEPNGILALQAMLSLATAQTYLFFVGLGFELSASLLLSRCSALEPYHQAFCSSCFGVGILILVQADWVTVLLGPLATATGITGMHIQLFFFFFLCLGQPGKQSSLSQPLCGLR